jgi:NarL family two-component system sensor histidine kinase LiaS
VERLSRIFRGLHWKLTLSYTLVTVAALLVVQLIAVILVWAAVNNSNIYPRAIIAVVKEELAPQIAGYLDDPEPDINGLAGWLQAAETSAGLTFQSINFPVAQVSLSDFDENTNLLVLDTNLHLLAGIPASIQKEYTLILDQADQAVAAALSGEDDPRQISQLTPNQTLTVAVPVVGKTQQVLGIVILRTKYPPRGILVGMISYVGGSLIFFTIAAGFVGTIFGFITARGLTHRLQHVTKVTDHWSQGDFSTFIQERSADEIGQMAQRLNRMAEQLQNLLQTRQELAAMNERNRLARDLHDSVKQQVFASTMQIGAARSMLNQDPDAAREHLAEAEQLSRQAQAELAALIRELRPFSLSEKGLNLALEDYVADWSRQSDIAVDISVANDLDLPTNIEQDLFRIAQEALSNITRHSEASSVAIQLHQEGDQVILIVSDNGKGFDVSAALGQGLGLRSMAERLQTLGGNLVVESEPGRGTWITARCPISK